MSHLSSVYLRVVQQVQYILSSHVAWPLKVIYCLWQGWCREEARLTWFCLTISNPLKTLTKSSAKAGTLPPAISHRKESRVVLYSLEFHFPSYIPLGRILWKIKVKLVKTPIKKTLVKVMLNDRRRNEDNTYSSRGTNKQSSLDVAWISSDYFESLLLPQ